MGCRKMETAKNWLMERILNSKGNSLKKWLIHQRKINLSLSVWLDHNLLENQPWWILHSAHNSSQVLVDVQKVFISLFKNFLTFTFTLKIFVDCVIRKQNGLTLLHFNSPGFFFRIFYSSIFLSSSWFHNGQHDTSTP